LHTNDSFGALTRLVDMGIEPFLVSSSVIAVLAQRLVRVVCPDCRQPYNPPEAELTRIGLGGVRLTKPIFKPAGCKLCRNTGYRGRTAITELMVVDDDVRSLVMQKADGSMIRRACTAKGMKLLRHDGADRILAGQTTVEELLRVTQEEIA
jgi:general secretion pathway protein E